MKIALIYQNRSPGWVSCRTIRNNLLSSYKATSNNNREFSYSLGANQNSLTLSNIRKFNPDKIIFLESNPPPLNFINDLFKSWSEFRTKEINFHIYGDFTVFTPEWSQIAKLLKFCPIKVLVASLAQAELIEKFIEFPKKNQISICPFPVDKKQFFINPDVRNQLRKKWEIAKTDFAIIYTGRISTQKNVSLATKWLDDWILKNQPKRKVKLFIVGQFDDIDAQFWKPTPHQGQCFHEWQQALKSTSPDFQKSIQYISFKDANALSELYNSCDLFLSLSTYHDEDYGMSPIEALCCGCPALLSAWGGFKSFAIDTKSVKLVPTKMAKNGILLNRKSFDLGLSYFLNAPESVSERIRRQNIFADNFSIEAITKLLEQQLKIKAPKFFGFSKLAHRHAAAVAHFKRGSLLFKSLGLSDPLYKLTYSSYYQAKAPSASQGRAS